ncbi:MAG TPA: BON domain-containing protein [Bryobacteraceae bacterium]|nr:BON domain-containing protein [Bryobacteraceae bacterium]
MKALTLRVRGIPQATGAPGVENKLAIASQPIIPDDRIAADVRDRPMWDAWVRASWLHVAVRHGNVILTGKVGSATEKRRARCDQQTKGRLNASR